MDQKGEKVPLILESLDFQIHFSSPLHLLNVRIKESIDSFITRGLQFFAKKTCKVISTSEMERC